MLAELMSVKNKNIDLVTFSKTLVSKFDFEQFYESDDHRSYFRLYWFFMAIVKWNFGRVTNDDSKKKDVWATLIEWLTEPSNIKVLSSTNIKLYLEIFFDLFLNFEFNHSKLIGETLLKNAQFIQMQMSDSNEVIEIAHEHDNFFIFKAILDNLFKF